MVDRFSSQPRVRFNALRAFGTMSFTSKGSIRSGAWPGAADEASEEKTRDVS
jgi:hypothetical protein